MLNVTNAKNCSKSQEIELPEITSWADITKFLNSIKTKTAKKYSPQQFSTETAKGIAFITYDYGIDGVSIEITKYASALQQIFTEKNKDLPLHFIGGEFHDKADIILHPDWQRYKIENMNGWKKWSGGRLFKKLFYEPMPSDSTVSSKVAIEIWDQVKIMTNRLHNYLQNNQINFLIPVNIASNPGNMASMLSVIIAAELSGCYVMCSNHDYYWEGGAPSGKSDTSGPRDHFFTNMDNEDFFALFQSIYPWNGQRWIQVNINQKQSTTLVEKYNFNQDKVFVLGTSLSNKFFELSTSPAHIKTIRKSMTYILSDGQPEISTVNINDHLKNLEYWINNQQPIVCGIQNKLKLDLSADGIIYFLQPTRIIMRKRIERDIELLKSLLNHPPFKDKIMRDLNSQIVIHITGPTPIEHLADLNLILKKYLELCENIPFTIARRIFIAFSVGHENHPALKRANLPALSIEEIYRLADIILFPSETEGRGLPIIEASASRVPIICNEYYPLEVFNEVIGKGLADEDRIEYFKFPPKNFSRQFLDTVSELLFHKEQYSNIIDHDWQAVHRRYSEESLRNKFKFLLTKMQTTL